MTCACVGYAWLQVTSGAGRKLPFSAMQAVAPGADLPSDRVVSVQDAAAASFSPSRRRRGSQEGTDAVGPEDAVSAAAAAAAERVRAWSHTSTASLAAAASVRKAIILAPTRELAQQIQKVALGQRTSERYVVCVVVVPVQNVSNPCRN